MEKVTLTIDVPLDIAKSINYECNRSQCSMADYITKAVYNNRFYLDTLRQMLASIEYKAHQRQLLRHYCNIQFMHMVEI